MELQGEIHYLADKRSAPFRGTWTLLTDGRVRQFFQEQDQSGTWQTWFEGYYSRIANN